ncbi:peptidyl-prolyl cis-trans isomerase CYP38, chloroplastic [Olea europaea subsp. europaea]|uniref:peptidylprolyl isomerase n=1 Tax=Olea europaea subsp. europaea TaxID=158383 RepID=A0A8S0PR61_OLEEU|nr:peptidyl-prolyl cis-trans isomerase CYP38, chloroplastic [Olea europaea subsp. europaea]
MMLPFNAFGTKAMAREEFDNHSGSSQVFWRLNESELTPSNANVLDGQYAVFGFGFFGRPKGWRCYRVSAGSVWPK